MAEAAPTLGVGITTDVGAVANAVTQAGKVVAQIQSELNTPAEIDAALRQEKQGRIDAINRAIETGDLNEIRKLSSV